MVKILLTAFEPYDIWRENASWLVLMEHLRQRSPDSRVTTRRYPVDFEKLKSRLRQDLEKGFDVVLHLGQAPGSAQIRLESLAVNVAGRVEAAGTDLPPLISGGNEAYRSRLPLAHWCQKLQEQGIPCQISYHAGTYLCNAAMYLSHAWQKELGHPDAVGFIHLPLLPSQVIQDGRGMPSLPLDLQAKSLTWILDDLLTTRPEIEQFA
ncbi:MAG: Pyrrolidone-carboxylate peptidase [Planctomycetota bacterium]